MGLIFNNRAAGRIDNQLFKWESWGISFLSMLLRLDKVGKRRGCAAQSHMKLAPSLHSSEPSTWSEATKKLILGTEPSPVN